MSVIATVEAKLHDLWAKLEAEGHHLADEAKTILADLKGDEPVLAADAEKDAADVVHTAATEGVIPAEQEAVKDAGELAGEVAADVKTAVEDAAHTPQQTTTVIAGETAVADSGQHTA